MIPETKKETVDTNEINKLKNLLDSAGESLSVDDFRQANDLLVKRVESPEGVKDNKRPMESIYTVNWEKVRTKENLLETLKECNPNYDNGKEWKINCQRCVPTYEMRKRGYDVTAKPKPKIIDTSGLSQKPFDVWQSPEVIRCSGNGQKDIENKMKQWGDGARAEIVVTWKNTNSGHAFVAEQVDGKTIFVDPQTGSQDVSKYFKMVETDSVQMCRIDQLDVTGKILECCRKAG